MFDYKTDWINEKLEMVFWKDAFNEIYNRNDYNFKHIHFNHKDYNDVVRKIDATVTSVDGTLYPYQLKLSHCTYPEHYPYINLTVNTMSNYANGIGDHEWYAFGCISNLVQSKLMKNGKQQSSVETSPTSAEAIIVERNKFDVVFFEWIKQGVLSTFNGTNGEYARVPFELIKAHNPFRHAFVWSPIGDEFNFTGIQSQ